MTKLIASLNLYSEVFMPGHEVFLGLGQIVFNKDPDGNGSTPPTQESLTHSNVGNGVWHPPNMEDIPLEATVENQIKRDGRMAASLTGLGRVKCRIPPQSKWDDPPST